MLNIVLEEKKMEKEEQKKQNGEVMSSRTKAACPHDEIVISGISGKFPSAKNVAEFANKLYNKVGEYISIMK